MTCRNEICQQSKKETKQVTEIGLFSKTEIRSNKSNSHEVD